MMNKMSETVTIPKKEYDRLIKCRRIVESEFEEKYSEEFIRDIKQSEEAYKKGNFTEIRNSQERKRLFDSL